VPSVAAKQALQLCRYAFGLLGTTPDSAGAFVFCLAPDLIALELLRLDGRVADELWLPLLEGACVEWQVAKTDLASKTVARRRSSSATSRRRSTYVFA
jgi:hypothetical protein